jgi:LPXTG-motif cell wall-anchored protein
MRPAFAPPRPVYAQPRTVYTPGPVRTIYRPVIDFAAINRARDAQRAYDRERFDLQRRAGHDARAAARLQMLQQQLMASQQAAAAAQAAQAQAQLTQQQAILNPMPSQIPQASVAPGSPAADLGPTQDASAASEGQEVPGPKKQHWLLIGGIVAAAGIGGYVLLHKKKKKSSSGD